MTPTTVFILFHETNSGHGQDSDGYVEGVYATWGAAEEARVKALRHWRDEGGRIFQDPDDPEAEEDPYWEHDFRIIEYPVDV